MAKRPPQNNDHHETLCQILNQMGLIEYRMNRIGLMTQHLLQHAHHLEALIVASAGSSIDPAQLAALKTASKALRAQLEASTAKNEANPPASTESGTPPQG